jgi:hypothetical protein
VRVPKGRFSRAVLRPRWYVRQLKNRPDGIAKRGPWRETRPKVEDAERLDALELYHHRDARPVGIGIYAGFHAEGRFDVGFRQHPPGTRSVQIGATTIRLFERQRVPGRSARMISAECPSCREQFRYLYLTHKSPNPKCRKCAGLIYKSQARSQVARYKPRYEMAETQRSWDGLKPIPHRFSSRFWHLPELIAQDLKLREQRIADREAKRLLVAARRELDRRWRDVRRDVGEIWRAYLRSLPKRSAARLACEYRKTSRLLALAGDRAPTEIVAGYLRNLADGIGDYPPVVMQFDARNASDVFIEAMGIAKLEPILTIRTLSEYEQGLADKTYTDNRADLWIPNYETRLRVAKVILGGRDAA